MALSPAQRKIASLIVGIGHHRGASRREIVSALETGLVESSLRNLSGGSGTSVGWRQETKGSYPNVNRRDVRASINRYYNETARAGRGKGRTAGQLAQAVQRSAYPHRYDQARGQALSIYRSLGGKGSADVSGGGLVPTSKTTVSYPQLQVGTTAAIDLLGQQEQPAMASVTPPPAPFFAAKAAVPQGYRPPLSSGGGPVQQPKTLSEQLRAVQALQGVQVPEPQVDTSTGLVGVPGGASGGGSPRRTKGVATFEGKKVAAWIAPELEYARRHGWKGTVTSGFRSRAEQTRIYNSGVRPAAKPGTSNHEGADYPRGAVDVSDAATLARILRRKRSPLKWAGSKDPVHFSHPHGGSY